MERRSALAAAGAATLMLGATIVAGASVSGASFLGFGTGTKASAGAAPGVAGADHRVVVRTRNVYDRYVVEPTGVAAASETPTYRTAGSRSTAAGAGGETSMPAPGGASPTTDTEPTTSVPTTEPPEHHRVASHPGEPADETPTTQPAAPSTTVAPVPSTTVPPTSARPPGVPQDWPPNRPIPPMPANCREPQLEDNGVWNCDH